MLDVYKGAAKDLRDKVEVISYKFVFFKIFFLLSIHFPIKGAGWGRGEGGEWGVTQQLVH